MKNRNIKNYLLTKINDETTKLHPITQFILNNEIQNWGMKIDSTMQERFIIELEESIEEAYVEERVLLEKTLKFVKKAYLTNMQQLQNVVFEDELVDNGKAIRKVLKDFFKGNKVDSDKVIFYLSLDTTYLVNLYENELIDLEHHELINNLISSIRTVIDMLGGIEQYKKSQQEHILYARYKTDIIESYMKLD
jgi:hypothetical protein